MADPNQHAYPQQGGYPAYPQPHAQGYPPYPGQQAYPQQGAYPQFPQQGGYPHQQQQVFPPSYGHHQAASTMEFESGQPQPSGQQGGQFKGNADAWQDQGIRMAFIRKVYTLLFLMLVVMCGLISLMLFVPEIKRFVQTSSWLYLTAFIVAFGVLIGLACAGDLRRKTPWNFIFLFIFVLAEGVMVGVICTYYDVQEVLWAFGITTVVTLGISIFACQTKYDFTMKSGLLLVLLMAFICFGFMMIFFNSQVMNVLYATLGAVLFGMFLVVDTQMIIGGNHQQQIHPEEYIFAALSLFVDIVNIFIMILSLVGGGGD